MPAWVLTFSFWVHMLATIVWIGGLFYQSFFVIPVLNTHLDLATRVDTLQTLNKRFSTATWLSLILLLATGMFQLVANSNYDGFLSISNQWSGAILLKHLAFLLMVVVASYQTWVFQPQLIRLMLVQATPQGDNAEGRVTALRRRLKQTSDLNLFIGLLVLAFTAIARTA